MIVTERKTDVFNQRAGGKGETIMEHIVDEKLYGGKIITYARVILKPGCSLGLHKHVGTSETMYLLQGTGLYNYNGKESTLHAGDVTFCPENESHSIENIGNDDLMIMALIVKENED